MTTIEIFDRNLQKHRREKAFKLAHEGYDFIHREIADRLSERVEEIKREFKDPMQMGVYGGILPFLMSHPNLTLADRCALEGNPAPKILDEELLGEEDATYDLVVSNMLLHWVNDLPGALIQFRKSLKPDGLFLAGLFGGETLKELRDCLMLAESEILGGVSPRISPFVDIRDAGSLLQRAGFALPVTDIDTITVDYSSPLKLMQDLRGMGESNLVIERRKFITPPSVLLRACEIYLQKYAGPDGRVPATFQIIYLTGWVPHESQQKPLKRGSATSSLAEALKTEEGKF